MISTAPPERMLDCDFLGADSSNVLGPGIRVCGITDVGCSSTWTDYILLPVAQVTDAVAVSRSMKLAAGFGDQPQMHNGGQHHRFDASRLRTSMKCPWAKIQHGGQDLIHWIINERRCKAMQLRRKLQGLGSLGRSERASFSNDRTIAVQRCQKCVQCDPLSPPRLIEQLHQPLQRCSHQLQQ